MNNLYYNLTGTNINQTSYVFVTEPLKTMKGATTVTFDLKKIITHGFGVVNITVNFNDKSPNYVRDFRYEEGYNILEENIVHTYMPSKDYDMVIYRPTISVTFLNNYSTFTELDIFVPIRISKPSFYSEHKRLMISSIQLIDEPDDPVFATLQKSNGDILNLKIK